ncbi:DUF3369 domain-containing protein [Azospirillum sp. SYSU D00513]|uniref:sensor histidine kinase n=1 Tax=Azospirillum sp. SYSU D00513 TaxID=2812561 RepID=UPI001FFF1138|nr:DUF3369 domain-containing protein [Azospirillum sp. SYSU D00513]
MDDDLLFRPDAEEEQSAAEGQAEPWTILVVDDDPQVHAMTAVLLRDFEFDGRRFEIVSALSAAEAQSVLAGRPEIPVALLDVVMETDDAGLRLVRHIRDVMGNTRMRIILRTGQPGQAPERDVVVAYDINDYKSKSELTAQRLFTALVSALRAWRDIVTIERHRQALERILSVSSALFEKRSMRGLVEGLVNQLGRVVDHGLAQPCAGSTVACREVVSGDGVRRISIVAATGRHSPLAGLPATEALPASLAADVALAFESQESAYSGDRCVLVFRTREHGVTVFLLERPEPYSADDHRLLELFCNRIAIGFDNVCLYEDLIALNQSLEQRVGDRTAELAANQVALVAAKERVERALERELAAGDNQRQFLAMVSHEFRTPLAIIDSAAQMLGFRAERIDPDMLERLSVIRTSVQRLTGLIEAHLTDERLQSGTLVLERRQVDLPALLRDVVRPFQVTHPGNRFELELDGLPSHLSGDANLLGLVFSNLVNNAVKYAGASPSVTIRGGKDGPMAVVEVVDNGCGIAENEIPRLFDRFFRGAGSVGVPGTGIGLHTVQQVVQLHGGAIDVDSEPGAGSTFRVVLPVRGATA